MPHVKNPNLDALIHQVEQSTAVMDSAVLFITGVPALIDAAVTKALQNGATEAELAPLKDLSDTLKAKSQAISDAISANTPEE